MDFISVLSRMRSDEWSRSEKMVKIPEFLRPIKEYLKDEE